MKITLNGTEYTIKFGYEATVKNKILKKVADLETSADDLEALDKMLMLAPELLLVGLQKFHSDAFGFDPYNESEKEQRMEQMYAILDDYLEENDMTSLIQNLIKELEDNSFLSRMLQQEQSKAKKTVAKKTTTTK